MAATFGRVPVRLSVAVAVLLSICFHSRAADSPRDALWAACRNEDPKGVKAALEKGVDVNAANEMGVTALWIAAGKKNLEVNFACIFN